MNDKGKANMNSCNVAIRFFPNLKCLPMKNLTFAYLAYLPHLHLLRVKSQKFHHLQKLHGMSSKRKLFQQDAQRI